jgi:energy-coupling factor transporter ATP-binding protein EcfA2
MNKENIKETFKLPIEYREHIPINDNINNDLELLNTVDNSNAPVYNHLFNPKTTVGEITIESWGKGYTNDSKFLKESQKIYSNFDISQNVDIVNKMTNDWSEIKGIEDIEEKYQYIEWDKLKWLNYNPILLQILSILNITSPLLQLVTPLIMLILPFFFLKLLGHNININNYIHILKQIIAKNQLGQILMNFQGASIKTKVYGLVMLGFYLYSIYQNIVSCYHFYTNAYYIIDKINSLKNYLKYTNDNMIKFSGLIEPYNTYTGFNSNLKNAIHNNENFINELDALPEKTKTIKTVRIFGVIMKTFYKLHYDTNINDLLLFSLGFNGYIDTLGGLNDNILNKDINPIKFSSSNKCSFKDIYHPSLKESNPIKNNISLSKSMIITGPNAAGKTTLLKSTIINLIFTQQTGFGFYRKGVLNPYKYIHSYINIPDSCSRDSLFQSEARRCKNILDIIEKNNKDRHFCVFDELYSGTNPYEAISNAYGYLDHIIKNKNVKIILTTHYIKLCKLFRDNKKIKNYNMETFVENHVSNNTYKLVPGYSTTKGGLAVLKSLNYPISIINKAEEIIENIE